MLNRFWKKPLGFKLSTVWIIFILFLAIFRDLLPGPAWDESTEALGVGPGSPGHFFGTTQDGFDVLAGIINGARLSVLVAVTSVLIGGGIGTFIGITAAYFKGKYDKVVNVVFNMMLSIPNLVLSLALISVLAATKDGVPASDGRKVFVMIISLIIVIIPILGRIARSATLQWSTREFIIASKSMGTKDMTIIKKHIVPNVAPAILAIGFFAIGVVIIVEGSLSILGIGIAGGASWGSMLAIGRSYLEFSPWETYFPVACIAFTVLSTNYFGDYVRANLDKRESKI